MLSKALVPVVLGVPAADGPETRKRLGIGLLRGAEVTVIQQLVRSFWPQRDIVLEGAASPWRLFDTDERQGVRRDTFRSHTLIIGVGLSPGRLTEGGSDVTLTSLCAFSSVEGVLTLATGSVRWG